jgi:glycosyltransferase involved in cell wall biosynthesis
MDLAEITPLILTFNEKENIACTLEPLSWAREVVIVDSGSSDGTLDIARSHHPNVRIVSRPFDSFASQCNFGLTQITTEWVLSLDADYVLTSELVAEIQKLDPPSDVAGYAAEFRYCIGGKPLRSTVYPPRTVLYRKERARYRDEGHGHRVVVEGRIEKLSGKIDHDDRKPLIRWFREQKRYAKIEAKHLLRIARSKEKGAGSAEELSFQDKLRLKIFFAAPAMFFYLLFIRGLILDGWRGCVYTFQRTLAELLLSVRLIAEMLKR